jgi:hypothetical protein
MWCTVCQQDVPGVASLDDGKIRCARCGTSPDRPSSADEAEQVAEAAGDKRRTVPSGMELTPAETRRISWELDQDLEQAEALLRRLGQRPVAAGAPAQRPNVFRTDPSHLLSSASPSRRAATGAGGFVASFCCWSFLSLGLTCLVLGGVLLGWSYVEDRPELWRAGLPCALGGQTALLLGLVIQLEILVRNGRQMHDCLHALDQELGELRRTVTLIASSHASPSQSFYAHLAEGASSHILLADLKGQLDLLASRLSERA